MDINYFDGVFNSERLTRDMCAAFSDGAGDSDTAALFFGLVRAVDGVGGLLLAFADDVRTFLGMPEAESAVKAPPVPVSEALRHFERIRLAGAAELYPAGIENFPLDIARTTAFLVSTDRLDIGILFAEGTAPSGLDDMAKLFIAQACDIFAIATSAQARAVALTEGQSRVERVLDSIDALIYVTDISTNEILFINDAMKKAFGLEDDVVGRKCWQALQEGIGSQCPFCPVHTLKSVDDPPIVWLEHNTKTERHYRNTDRLIKWVDDRVVHVQYSVDITEDKNTKEKLDKTQLTLETIFNAVPSAIFWKTRDGRFEGANRQFLDIIGLEEKDLLGKSEYEISPPETAKLYVEEDRMLLSGEVESLEFERQLDKDVWTRQKKVTVKNVRGENISVLGIIDDISVLKLSELKLLEQQALLEAAMEDAKAASQAKSVFLSRMSHEIRTPMNAIIGMTKIASDSVDIGRIKSCLQKITIASNSLLEIINDVLDMSKIEAGKLVLADEDFVFEKLLMNISEVILVKSDEKHQSVNFILDGRIPAVLHGDQLRLSQVITNLLSNAIKFTPPYGKILLRATLASETKDSVRIGFVIHDNGIGITDEQRSRLFTAFEQADGSISRKFGGTGLGLVICKNIVEMMGGSIEVESDGQSYSKFIFDVALGKSRAQANTEKIRFEDCVRLLLIDDDADTRDYFMHIAERIGVYARVADSGRTAAAICAEEDFDAIFVDFLMPHMDGIQTVRALKELRPGAKYILISCAVDFAEIGELAAKEGIKYFISKPLFDSVILSAIENVSCGLTDGTQEKDVFKPYFHGKRILLVEDIEINREIVHELLRDTGVTIDEVENGSGAVEMVEKNERYDLILMDIHMPVMNGYEASLAIRELKSEGAATVPIIAMTADVFAEDIQCCIDAKMDGHMAKPIKTEELFRVLAKYLGG